MSGANHFQELQRRVAQAFPELAPSVVVYACNKIARHIKRSAHDCHDVSISREFVAGPDYGAAYYTYFEVEASGIKIVVRMTVD